MHVEPQDLADTTRLLLLHGQAVEQGLAPRGERGELEFVALSEHARAYATSNAPGMFAWLVRNYERTAKRFLTQDDEEAARRRLREHRFGLRPQPTPKVEPREESSPIAVRALLEQLLGQVGERGMALRP